jgi:hypothetical protein
VGGTLPAARVSRGKVMPATSTMGESGRRESNPHRELGKLEFCH